MRTSHPQSREYRCGGTEHAAPSFEKSAVASQARARVPFPPWPAACSVGGWGRHGCAVVGEREQRPPLAAPMAPGDVDEEEPTSIAEDSGCAHEHAHSVIASHVKGRLITLMVRIGHILPLASLVGSGARVAAGRWPQRGGEGGVPRESRALAQLLVVGRAATGGRRST